MTLIEATTLSVSPVHTSVLAYFVLLKQSNETGSFMKNRNLLLIVLETNKFKVKGTASGQGLLTVSSHGRQ